MMNDKDEWAETFESLCGGLEFVMITKSNSGRVELRVKSYFNEKYISTSCSIRRYSFMEKLNSCIEKITEESK